MKNGFEHDALYYDGERIPCEYRISSTGRTMTAVYTYGGERFKLSAWGDATFAAMYKAHKLFQATEIDLDEMQEIIGSAAPIEARKPRIRPELTDEQKAAKAAHGDVPEKTFIGEVWHGKGFTVKFDGVEQRTRIITDGMPCRKLHELLKAGGWHWSPSLQSWNKGLNWRAYRAALQLMEA